MRACATFAHWAGEPLTLDTLELQGREGEPLVEIKFFGGLPHRRLHAGSGGPLPGPLGRERIRIDELIVYVLPLDRMNAAFDLTM